MTIIPETPIRERREIQRPNEVGDHHASAPTASRRSRASSSTPRTCAWRGCCTARRCAARTRARTSGASTSARRWPSPASTPCSPTTTCRGARPTAWRSPDQPVLAINHVRYQGEPVAIVAADHPETARRAADAIVVDYDELEPLTDAEAAMAPGAPELHPDTPDTPRLHGTGNVLRHVRINHGDPDGDGRRRGQRRVRGRHAGPGLPRARVGPRGARRRGRRRPLHRHPVAARRPGPGGRVARPAAREGAPHPRRRRRRLRRARGPLDADPRLHARPAHRAPGADGLQPRGVLLRPRPPPPVHDALRARRHARRPPGLRARADRARRRRLRLELDRRVRQRGVLRLRALRGAQRAHRQLRRLHQQPAVRGDARLRRRAGRLRPRGADGQAGRGARHGPRRPADPQRHDARQPHAHRPARRRARRRWPSCSSACARCRCRPTDGRRPARRRRERDPRRGRAPRRRLRDRDQEHRLLGGLRRLLDRARAAVDGGRRAARRGPHGRRRGGPGDRHRAGADRAHRARASSAWRCSTPTRGSARRGRPRPRARPTSPAARSRRRARRCASAWRRWPPSAA